MNKKIKVIELLLKIAHGEYPKKFKYNNKIYEYKRIVQGTGYVTENYDWFNSDIYIDDWDNLNEYVEILEDNTEEIEELTYFCIGNAKSTDQTKMIDKINELVRIVNSIRKNIDKEYCCCCGVEITDENRAMNDMCNECKYGIDWKEKE